MTPQETIRRRPPTELLADTIKRRCRLDENGCWVWTGYRSYWGYGQIAVNRRSRPAHCVAYEQFIGPIPDGLEVDHLCHNRACCNPVHLEAVTPARTAAVAPPRDPRTARRTTS